MIFLWITMIESQEKTKGNQNHAAFEIHRLGNAFGNIYAMKELGLQVPKNFVSSFIDPNDAEKTNTIKLLLGLTRFTSGGGTILGHDLTSENKTILSQAGHISQNQHYLIELNYSLEKSQNEFN
jgi:ABC-type multidrug transport system ATPase subunit